MAILSSYPGVTVSIVCNGAVLQEYEDIEQEERDHTIVTKYVEAFSGAEFGIRCEINSPWPQYTILFKYWLDRKFASSRFCKSTRYGRCPFIFIKEGADTVASGQTYLHKFAFAALTVDDSGTVTMQNELMKDVKRIGQITVKGFFIHKLRVVEVDDFAVNKNIKELGKLPEKALKGRSLSHQTTLRAPQAIKEIRRATFDFVHPAERPFATYTFKYRSKDALKSLLVIPRSPSPVALEDRDIDTLSADEMRELLRRQRELNKTAEAVKQENGIKRERNSTHADNAVDENEVSVVSTKRLRENYQITVNEAGVEEIDLI